MTTEEIIELSKEYDIEVITENGQSRGRLYSEFFRSQNGYDTLWLPMSGNLYTFSDVMLDSYANKMSLTNLARIDDVHVASVRILWDRLLTKKAHIEETCARKAISSSRLILRDLMS